MITLDIAGKFLPIPKDFSIQLTWKNPATDFDKVPTGFGADFSFPINDFYQAIFGNPQRYAKYRATNDQKFPDFHVRFDGALFMSGTLTITDSSGGNYNCSLIDQVGVLGEKEQERSILDIPFFSTEQNFINKSQYTPDADAYCCFPISNPSFFKDKGLIVECKRKVTDPNNPAKQIDEKYDTELLTNLFAYTRTNIFGELVGSRVNSTNPDGTVITQYASNISLADPANRNPGGFPSASLVSVVSPFFFLNYIISKSLADHDITIDANYLNSHVALRNLAIYNTFDITKATFTTTGDYITIGTFQGGVKVLGKSISYYIRSNPNKIIPKNHLPKMKVGEMVLSTQNLFNVCFHFLPNSTVNIYSRDALLTGSSTDLDKYFLGSWDIGEKKNVALKFTREHDDKDLVFSERFKDLSDRRNDLKEQVMSWDDLRYAPAHDGDIRFVANAKIFAECKWITVSDDGVGTQKAGSKDILGWEEASIGLQDGWYKFGREEVEEIKTLWSTPYANFGTLEVNQSGNTSAWPSKAQEFSPRLMFRIPGYSFNSGSNEFSGELVSDNNKLYLEYEYIDGIFDKFWRNWNPFWANRLPVTGTFNLPVNVLRHLIYNICKKYRTREGEFLIDEMSCTLYVDRISETTIKAFKVD